MAHRSTSPETQAEEAEEGRSASTAKRIFKWVAFIAALLFFFAVVRQAVDPYGDQPYVEITHGDHTHYVPKERDPNVPVGKFPTRAPGPDERITPEGRIVAK